MASTKPWNSSDMLLYVSHIKRYLVPVVSVFAVNQMLHVYAVFENLLLLYFVIGLDLAQRTHFSASVHSSVVCFRDILIA